MNTTGLFFKSHKEENKEALKQHSSARTGSFSNLIYIESRTSCDSAIAHALEDELTYKPEGEENEGNTKNFLLSLGSPLRALKLHGELDPTVVLRSPDASPTAPRASSGTRALGASPPIIPCPERDADSAPSRPQWSPVSQVPQGAAVSQGASDVTVVVDYFTRVSDETDLGEDAHGAADSSHGLFGSPTTGGNTNTATSVNFATDHTNGRDSGGVGDLEMRPSLPPRGSGTWAEAKKVIFSGLSRSSSLASADRKSEGQVVSPWSGEAGLGSTGASAAPPAELATSEWSCLRLPPIAEDGEKDILISRSLSSAPSTQMLQPKTVLSLATHESTSDHRQRLLSRLTQYDLEEKNVSGDGNCQFRSLSDQLYGSQEYYREVRAAVVSKLRKDWAKYEAYIPMELHGSFYVDKMALSGTWGDHVTLQAAADQYNMRIVILTSFRECPVITIEPSPPLEVLPPTGKEASSTFHAAAKKLAKVAGQKVSSSSSSAMGMGTGAGAGGKVNGKKLSIASMLLPGGFHRRSTSKDLSGAGGMGTPTGSAAGAAEKAANGVKNSPSASSLGDCIPGSQSDRRPMSDGGTSAGGWDGQASSGGSGSGPSKLSPLDSIKDSTAPQTESPRSFQGPNPAADRSDHPHAQSGDIVGAAASGGEVNRDRNERETGAQKSEAPVSGTGPGRFCVVEGVDGVAKVTGLLSGGGHGDEGSAPTSPREVLDTAAAAAVGASNGAATVADEGTPAAETPKLRALFLSFWAEVHYNSLYPAAAVYRSCLPPSSPVAASAVTASPVAGGEATPATKTAPSRASSLAAPCKLPASADAAASEMSRQNVVAPFAGKGAVVSVFSKHANEVPSEASGSRSDAGGAPSGPSAQFSMSEGGGGATLGHASSINRAALSLNGSTPAPLALRGRGSGALTGGALSTSSTTFIGGSATMPRSSFGLDEGGYGGVIAGNTCSCAHARSLSDPHEGPPRDSLATAATFSYSSSPSSWVAQGLGSCHQASHPVSDPGPIYTAGKVDCNVIQIIRKSMSLGDGDDASNLRIAPSSESPFSVAAFDSDRTVTSQSQPPRDGDVALGMSGMPSGVAFWPGGPVDGVVANGELLPACSGTVSTKQVVSSSNRKVPSPIVVSGSIPPPSLPSPLAAPAIRPTALGHLAGLPANGGDATDWNPPSVASRIISMEPLEEGQARAPLSPAFASAASLRRDRGGLSRAGGSLLDPGLLDLDDLALKHTSAMGTVVPAAEGSLMRTGPSDEDCRPEDGNSHHPAERMDRSDRSPGGMGRDVPRTFELSGPSLATNSTMQITEAAFGPEKSTGAHSAFVSLSSNSNVAALTSATHGAAYLFSQPSGAGGVCALLSAQSAPAPIPQFSDVSSGSADVIVRVVPYPEMAEHEQLRSVYSGGSMDPARAGCEGGLADHLAIKPYKPCELSEVLGVCPKCAKTVRSIGGGGVVSGDTAVFNLAPPVTALDSPDQRLVSSSADAAVYPRDETQPAGFPATVPKTIAENCFASSSEMRIRETFVASSTAAQPAVPTRVVSPFANLAHLAPSSSTATMSSRSEAFDASLPRSKSGNIAMLTSTHSMEPSVAAALRSGAGRACSMKESSVFRSAAEDAALQSLAAAAAAAHGLRHPAVPPVIMEAESRTDRELWVLPEMMLTEAVAANATADGVIYGRRPVLPPPEPRVYGDADGAKGKKIKYQKVFGSRKLGKFLGFIEGSVGSGSIDVGI